MNLDHLKYCTALAHHSAYSCARCARTCCMDCDHASDVEMIKTAVRYCPDWRCQRERKMEEGVLVDRPLIHGARTPVTMIAELANPIDLAPPFGPSNNLVMVKLPPNCYIDAERGNAEGLREIAAGAMRDCPCGCGLRTNGTFVCGVCKRETSNAHHDGLYDSCPDCADEMGNA